MPAALLRAWERRYRVVAPARTASGYRLYDEGAIERLRTMRRLVDAGWAPSTAAVSILDGTVAPDQASDEAIQDRGDGVDGAPGAEVERFAQAFVRAARDVDMLPWTPCSTISSPAVVRTCARRPALSCPAKAGSRLGRAAMSAWQASISLRQPSCAASVSRSMRGVYGTGAAHVVIGLPRVAATSSARLAFAVAARRAGLAVRYLGPDLPIDRLGRRGRG